MAGTLLVPKNAIWFRHVGKLVAVAASSGAALVSILTALYSYGVIGASESHQSIGNLGAAWVGLRPFADTASAIGDTVHYAATVTDKNGSILVGARPTWTTGDSTVARVLPDGSVIARGPGRTVVTVVVGKFIAHSRFIVQQRVETIQVTQPAGDTVFTIPEGGKVLLHAKALDGRGHNIAGLVPMWKVDDTTVAVLDSTGVLTARNAGRTAVTARIEGISGRSAVSVVTPAASLAVVAGTDQSGVAGLPLPQAIVVRATDRRGAPVSGKAVDFRLPELQGKIEPASMRTDADGRARAVWTLGRYPGRQRLLATVENVDSALTIIAEAEPVAENTRIAPVVGSLSGRAGEAVSEIVGIRLTDSAGRVLPDVPVRWAVIDGGSVEPVNPRTDSLGLAHVKWTLGKKTGEQKLRAQVGSGPASRSLVPVILTATALAGAPETITIESGAEQRGTVGADLPKPVVVRVVDVNGSGVANAEVEFSPSAGHLADSLLRTDSLGRARVSWSMGRSAGPHTLAVHVEGVKKVAKMVVVARPARPANLSFDDAVRPGKANRSGQPKRLYAVVTDLYGNPVPDAKVSFKATSGTVTPRRAMSDAKGRTELIWKIGTKPGEQVLSGAVLATDVRGDYTVDVGGAPRVQKTASLKPKAGS